MCGRTGLVTPGTVGVANGFVECLGLATSPAYTMDIIELTLRGVAEEIIGGNDKTIAFQTNLMRDVINIGSMAVSVGVVDFDKLVESVLGIWSVTPHREDLVGRRISSLWPFGNLIITEGVPSVVIYCSISSVSFYRAGRCGRVASSCPSR
jgi:hypothetical protein